MNDPTQGIDFKSSSGWWNLLAQSLTWVTKNGIDYVFEKAKKFVQPVDTSNGGIDLRLHDLDFLPVGTACTGRLPAATIVKIIRLNSYVEKNGTVQNIFQELWVSITLPRFGPSIQQLPIATTRLGIIRDHLKMTKVTRVSVGC